MAVGSGKTDMFAISKLATFETLMDTNKCAWRLARCRIEIFTDNLAESGAPAKGLKEFALIDRWAALREMLELCHISGKISLNPVEGQRFL